MRKFGIFLLFIAIPLAYFQLGHKRQVLSYSYEIVTNVDSEISRISSSSSINISTVPTHTTGSIRFSELTDDDDGYLATYLPLLRDEIRKYSAEAVQESGIKAIYLVKDLQIINRGKIYQVAGAADYKYDTIYINITTNQIIENNQVSYSPANDCDPTEFARGILHHELWHIYEHNNPKLAEHNHDKEYGAQNNLSVSADRCLNPDAEFVSNYASTTASEDRAEQFRAKMTFMSN